MNTTKLPIFANWDICDACQLRCAHCYTESGRRKERRLSTEQMTHVVDILTSMPLDSVQISGGEPTLVHELPTILQRLRAHIPAVHVYTNAQDLSLAAAEALLTHATDIHVSLDGGDAAVNDAIRGVSGAFEKARAGLSLLNDLALSMRRRGLSHAALGIDTVLVRSNFRSLETLCLDVVNSFGALSFLNVGAAVPSGLAAEPAYAQSELLLEDELEQVRDQALTQKLRALSPSLSHLSLSDNFALLFSPERIAAGQALTTLMHIEANADVRIMPTSEGTVGNLLLEPADVLWQRVQQRWQDPFVVQQLSGVQNMQAWAAAAYNIDRHFASRDTLLRLAARAAPRKSPRVLVS